MTKNVHVTKAIKAEQKRQKLIEELSGLNELETQGLNVKSKADELIQKLDKTGILEKLGEHRCYNTDTGGTNSYLKKQVNSIGTKIISKWDDINCVFEMETKTENKRERVDPTASKEAKERDRKIRNKKKIKKPHGYKPESTYKWYSNLKQQMNTARPTQWYEEAENAGLLNGNGECAKRLRQLAKKGPAKSQEAN